MKTALAWTAAVALAAASASALAVGPGPLGPIDNVPIAISNIVPMGIFQDVYTFSVGDPFVLSGTVSPINFSPYNILGLTVTLQDATFAVIGSDSSPDTGFAFSGLSSGNYSLNVLGFANGGDGGFYAGGFIATTGSGPVPVPEPGTLTLLGLGLAGLAATRRRKK